MIQQFLNNVTLFFKNKVFAISFKLFLISCANIQLIISILEVLKILTILFLLIIYLFFLAKIISYFGWNIDDVLINFQNIRFFNLKSRTDRITSLFIISASFLVLCGLWWNNNSVNFIFFFVLLKLAIFFIIFNFIKIIYFFIQKLILQLLLFIIDGFLLFLLLW